MKAVNIFTHKTDHHAEKDPDAPLRNNTDGGRAPDPKSRTT